MSARSHACDPLVSVVIPCFNQARYLNEAIKSLLNQTYERVEIIVVDDGSTDDTAQVATGYPDVVLISQENRGLSAARNRGIQASHGDLLVFLDADDRLLPVALSAGVACLYAHPECAFAYGQFQFIHADGTLMRKMGRKPGGRNAYLEFLRVNRVAMHAAVIYRRGVFKHVGGFNTALRRCEDYDMYLRIVRRFPVAEHPAMVAEYRRHPESISNDARAMLESTLAVLDGELPYITNNPERLAAFQEGRRQVTGFYTFRLIRGALPPRINRSNWRRSFADLWWLIRSHPGGFIHLGLWLPTIVESRIHSWREYASA